ncbi:MAG TPA: helix-turn-helix domain-containing protein [Candidatus Fusicatenibacter intestinigallinarum]|uniref:Helix-turn-helix domain-containing protein n=1 Tax=Candidatus Fusicatenibacter intestinigallinarum TaxID=2838598 RepID=A0A9D2SNI3_9FIRM|nr:helix-turn-helix domain-containing protein [Candidatus Fusicatenibacter intestinigallinarum]
MVSLGRQIAKFRKNRGLKQEELAEMVSLSTSYISAIERGVKNPTLENFIAIANVLKVSSDELLREELEVRFDIQMTQLGAMLESLDDNEKERILHVVAVMIKDAAK